VAERATIARPYAKAAFEYARGANALAAWSEGLKVAAEIVADPRVAPLTKSPAWSASDLVSLITDVAEPKLDAGMQNFVRVLAENHRLLLLPEIAAHYEVLRSAVENTVDVEVVSAVPLDARSGRQASAGLEHALEAPGAHAKFGRFDAAGRRRGACGRSGHRWFAERPPGTARHEFTSQN